MAPVLPRPPFLVASADVPETRHRYPDSDELLAPVRSIGRAAGLQRIGLHLHRVLPGTRISWPHAEESEDEFVYVVEGEVDAWIDGVLHRLGPGDLAAFPAETGVCHTFLNNGSEDAILLAGGEASKPGCRTVYPLHPQRRADSPSEHWDDAPLAPQGAHDGKPDAQRGPAPQTTRATEPVVREEPALAWQTRLAQTSDVPTIVHLLGDDELGKTRNPPYLEAASAYDAAFAELSKGPDNCVIVGTRGGVVVGCYQLTFIRGLSHTGALRAQIESVRIASTLRGRGYGSLLMVDALERARARGAYQAQLTTDLRRPETRRFYERLGFVASHAGMKIVL